jgi:Lon protease-like protein
MIIPLFPLSQGLFPDSVLSLNIFEIRYLNLIKRCQQEQIPFGVVPLAEGREVQKAGETERLHDFGCMAHITQVETLQPAVLFVRCLGGQRFALGEHSRGPYGLWSGSITLLDADTSKPIPPHLQPLADQLGELIASAQKQNVASKLPMTPPYRLDECGWVANRWADLLPLRAAEKTELLAEADPLARLQRVSHWIE